MVYIKNSGRYALAFTVVVNGFEKKISLDKQRYYQDTGNLATSGITPISDEDYKLLKANARFNTLVKAGDLTVTDKIEITTTEAKVVSLEKENAELKAKLGKETSTETKKELKAKDKEIASLKAQLEALSKSAKEETAETEGF